MFEIIALALLQLATLTGNPIANSQNSSNQTVNHSGGSSGWGDGHINSASGGSSGWGDGHINSASGGSSGWGDGHLTADSGGTSGWGDGH